VQIKDKKIQSSRKRSLLAVALFFLACFLVVAAFRGSFSSLNLSVNLWAASINNGPFTIVAKEISVVFDTTFLGITSIVLGVILFLMNYKRFGFLMLSAMGGDALIVLFFKAVVMSQRPLNEIIPETGFSFPSGHVAGCVVFFGVLTYIAWKRWSTLRAKAATCGLYVSITAIVGFDRIYLNVHWLSDEIGGVFLGAFWVLLCISIFEYLTFNNRSKVNKLIGLK
jgi:undecaprenyl-diphosphatase